MDYLDFELKIGVGVGRDYPVEVVRSPAGEQRATMHFPFDELQLKNQLQGLQIALLRSGGSRRNMASAPQEKQSVEDFGRALFTALLPEEVRSCYRISREKALAEGKGLRLRLRLEAPDLAALPWEFLYDDSEGDFICLSNETPVIRYLELDRAPSPVTIEPPLRILGMIASPEDRMALDVNREKQRMEQSLAELEARGLVSLTWLEGQTWRDLQRAMRQGPWHVFHFVGHGGFDTVSGEGMLALANEDGSTFRLPATQLGRLLADHNALRLAVLNACEGAQASDTDIFSSTASVLIRRGLPAVVAMQYEITDQAAIEFAHNFYETIAEGLPVDAAVSEARKAISLSVANTVEWGTPVLHMRAPDGRLFTIDASTVPAPRSLPKAPTAELQVASEQVAREAVAAPSVSPAPPLPHAAPASEQRRKFGGRTAYWAGGAGLLLILLLVFLLGGGEDDYADDTDLDTPDEAIAQLLAAHGYDGTNPPDAHEVASMIVADWEGLQREGYAMFEEGTSIQTLSTGASMTVDIELLEGFEYEIDGYCDLDCDNLDLSLTGDDGTFASDTDAQPVLLFTPPYTATYEAHLTLLRCATGECIVGLGVFGRPTSEEAIAQSTPQQVPALPLSNGDVDDLAACYEGTWVEADAIHSTWTFLLEDDQLHIERFDGGYRASLSMQDRQWQGALVSGDGTQRIEPFVLEPATAACTAIRTNQIWSYVRPAP